MCGYKFSSLSLSNLVVIIGFILTTVQSRASEYDAQKYPVIDTLFRERGDDIYWRSYKVKTMDGYILNMFRIIGQSDGTKLENAGDKGPLVLIHGFGSSGYTWFNYKDTSMPVIPVQLYNDGYDVWIANTRGNQFSNKHRVYDSNDPQYWNFDVSDKAEKDLHALFKKILKKSNTCKKITVLAHSGGTTETANFLTKATKAHRYISQVIFYEPCIIANVDYLFPGIDDDFYRIIDAGLQLIGLPSLWSPKWDKDTNQICNWIGEDNTICDSLKGYEVVSDTNWFGYHETSV